MSEELIPLDSDDFDFPVDARTLWNGLEVGRDFSTWIKERIEKYGFVEGEDFSPKRGKSTGGRASIEYKLSLDMAKELAMVENNEIGRKVRKYFISIEKKYRETTETRKISKIIRREITDSIKDSGLNEKMNGFAYKTVTDLVYKASIGKTAKQYRMLYELPPKSNVREYLTNKQLKEVSKVERVVSSLLDINMSYEDIKKILLQKVILEENKSLE